MKNLKYILTFILTSSILTTCNQSTDKKSENVGENEELVKPKNVSETISTDIDKLGELLDFSIHRPTSVNMNSQNSGVKIYILI